MNFAIKRLAACSVCGGVSLGHKGWFLVLENRWMDRLKVLRWDAQLATQREVRSACSRDHLRLLVSYWLAKASLCLATPRQELPISLTGIPDVEEIELEPRVTRMLGELTVQRESFGKGWAGSAEQLEAILDAMIVPEAEMQSSIANRGGADQTSRPFKSDRAMLRRSAAASAVF